MKKHICQSCGAPLDEFSKDQIIKEGFCPFCVNEKGELKEYKDIFQSMIDYLKSDHPEVKEDDRPDAAEKMLEDESPIWGEEFKGNIIKESLESEEVFDLINVESVKESKDDNPETNHGFPIWHIAEISFKRTKLEKVLGTLNRIILAGMWWVDVSHDNEIYIIFRNKIFKGDKTDVKFCETVNKYAISKGLSFDQLPFRNFSSKLYVIEELKHGHKICKEIVNTVIKHKLENEKILGEWDLKSIVLHLSLWHRIDDEAVKEVQSGVEPQYINMNPDKINDAEISKNHNKSLDVIISDWEDNFNKHIKSLETLGLDEYNKKFDYKDTSGKPFRIAWIYEYRYRELEHEAGHAKDLEDFLAKVS